MSYFSSWKVEELRDVRKIILLSDSVDFLHSTNSLDIKKRGAFLFQEQSVIELITRKMEKRLCLNESKIDVEAWWYPGSAFKNRAVQNSNTKNSIFHLTHSLSRCLNEFNIEKLHSAVGQVFSQNDINQLALTLKPPSLLQGGWSKCSVDLETMKKRVIDFSKNSHFSSDNKNHSLVSSKYCLSNFPRRQHWKEQRLDIILTLDLPIVSSCLICGTKKPLKRHLALCHKVDFHDVGKFKEMVKTAYTSHSYNKASGCSYSEIDTMSILHNQLVSRGCATDVNTDEEEFDCNKCD